MGLTQGKPKPGGLFYNNKTAFVDSTLNANKDKEWVGRLYNKNTPKITLPGEDRPSTHLMADDGKGYVFPTLIQQPGQSSLTNMGPYAEKYARKNNTGIQFKKKEQGDYFASHDNGNGNFGGYKKGTGVLPEFKDGVKDMKINIKTPPKPNKTRDFLKSVSPTHPGNQAFWGEALNDIPHPDKQGQVMNYGQFKDYLKSPELLKKEGFNDETKRNAYGDSVFKSAQERLYKRADSNPDTMAFPSSAVDALNKPVDDFKAKHGDYVQGNGKAYTPEIGAQRLNDIKSSSVASFQKGAKSIKVKKAASGLQDIAVPQQGSYSDVLSSGSTLASAGAQFGPWGAGIGAIAGLGMGLFNKNKQDQAYKLGTLTNKENKMNRSYTGNEVTANQAGQVFKKGGVVRTKTIEIEGKKTPEIHTDKNFNVKNLGTTPHSMGGDKVQAEEGDIVFNTQNSITKFNKIATAIKEGDHSTLKKEKNALPEDSGVKNQTGNRGVKKVQSADDYVKSSGAKQEQFFGKLLGGVSTFKDAPGKSSTAKDGTWRKTDDKGNTYYSNGRMKKADGSMSNIPAAAPRPTSPLIQPKISGNLDMSIDPKVFNVPTKPRNYVTKDPAFHGYDLPGIKALPKGKPTAGKIVRKTNPVNAIDPMTSFKPGYTDADLTDLTGVQSRDQKLASGNMTMNKVGGSNPLGAKPATSPTATKTGPDFGKIAGNAMQFAGVANNIFQGLKSEPGIQQNYVTPEKQVYTDRSQSLRNQSVSTMNVQNANSRNLSGGLASNLRANMTAANLGNMSRQGDINEREQGRADAINAQNVAAQNQANEVNAQKRDGYQQILMGNRAAKESFIGQAASDIGQYGQLKQQEGYLRSRDALANQSQLAGLQAINGNSKFQFNTNGTSTFNGAAGTPALFGRRKPAIGLDNNLDGNTKDDIQYKKGVKKIKVKK